jgi:hypothetical protein
MINRNPERTAAAASVPSVNVPTGDFQGGLQGVPKSAVPTRTRVAPSSTATV